MPQKFILPYEIKKRLFDEILKLDNPFNLSDSFTLADFLSKILPLRDMPSEDSRYNNAYYDAHQHLVRNNDWSLEETFEKRFKIIENNETFKKLLEVILNNSEEGNVEVKKSLFNKYLNKYQYRINQKYNDSSKLEFFIVRIENDYIPSDFPENDIPFFVIDKYNTSFIPKHYPCVILQEKDWNDWFKYRTSFNICYVEYQSNVNFIGDIKILNINNPITFDVINKEFYKLDSNYCSLIQDEVTYFSLKHILGDRLYSFLSALNDVACFPSICEKFEKEEGFKISLCRETNKTEEIIRTIRHKLKYGKNIKDFFNFELLFKPPYSESKVSFKFNFDIEKNIPQRLYCLIGKNGVGKTTFLKDLIKKL